MTDISNHQQTHQPRPARRAEITAHTDPISPWVIMFIMWLFAWGLPMLSNLVPDDGSGNSSDGNPWSSGPESTIITITLTAVSLIFLIIGIKTCKIRPRAVGLTIPARASSLYWLPAAFLMALGAGRIQNWLNEIIKNHSSTIPTYDPGTLTGSEAAYTLFSVTISGPAEELCLIIGIITLARIGLYKHPRAGIIVGIVLALLARIGIHLYYGTALAPAYGLWALLLVGIWWITPSIWGQVAAHLAYNSYSILQMTEAGGDGWRSLYHGLAWAGLAVMAIHLLLLICTKGRRGRFISAEPITAPPKQPASVSEADDAEKTTGSMVRSS